MAVAGLAATSFFSGAIGQSAHNRFRHTQQDFQQLGQDLQAGNLTQAQSDFAALQKDYPGAQANSGVESGGAAAFQKLAQDLQSGNLSAAQTDFKSLQIDAQQGGGVAGNPHHRSSHGLGATEQDASQLFSQLGQALQAGNIAAAQRSYGSLTKDFQQLSSGGGAQTGYWPVPGFVHIDA